MHSTSESHVLDILNWKVKLGRHLKAMIPLKSLAAVTFKVCKGEGQRRVPIPQYLVSCFS